MYRFLFTAIALLLIYSVGAAEPSLQNVQFAGLTGEAALSSVAAPSGDEYRDARPTLSSAAARFMHAEALTSFASMEPASVLPAPASIIRHDEQLPDFISFEGSFVKDLVRLNWTVTPGAKALGFVVERRSQADEKWATISYSRVNPRQKGQGYSFLDESGVHGVTYYRLRQVAASGSSMPTPAICVMPSMVPNSFVIWQHNVDSFTRFGTLSFGLHSEMPVNVTMVDSYGRNVATLINNANLEAGHHIIPFSTSSLPSGVYTLRLETSAGVQLQRLAIL
ncbi:MAG: T9SS type A sorting domain-containing protein [Bacteroidetes bacterium]|nr:T9SS type A sorting domain-containing protein [Bacteroidota bacterium]